MILRPPIVTRTHSFPTRRSSEWDGAGVGDRGPEDRLLESRKCRVRSERITPNARRSCVLVRRSSALCEQVHSKIPGIRDFAAEIPRRDLKYCVGRYSRKRRRNANRSPVASSVLTGPRSTRVVPVSDRKRVVYGKGVTVRVDLGGRLIHKKKKTQ